MATDTITEPSVAPLHERSPQTDITPGHSFDREVALLGLLRAYGVRPERDAPEEAADPA
jgi:hypothetical protein